MKQRGILFSAPMVRALLAGRKTMTRRACKPLVGATGVRDVYHRPDGLFIGLHLPRGAGVGVTAPFSCPYGAPGDRLWVRETWYDDMPGEPATARDRFDDGRVGGIEYRATHDCTSFEAGCPCNPDGDGKRSEWRPSLFMPRWASRITLEVTEVRVERLQDISEEDAKAEGVTLGEPLTGTINGMPASVTYFDARTAFGHLWGAINGAESWAANPFVWVVGFTRVERRQ